MTEGSFALSLQRLSTDQERVLALAANLNSAPRFRLNELSTAFDQLHVPKPKNLSAVVSRLAQRKMVVKAGDGGWGVTPVGREKGLSLIAANISPDVIAAAKQAPGAEIGHAYQNVISPANAPAKFVPAIGRFLQTYDFDSSVFCMTRFPSGPGDNDYLDPVTDAIETIRQGLSSHGLVLHLASDRQIDDDLMGNVLAHMWSCRFGIGLLENLADRGLNYNVVTELGGMMMTGRRCALLKDPSAGVLPSDLASHIYKSIDLSDQPQVHRAVHLWVANDLSLGTCKECPKL